MFYAVKANPAPEVLSLLAKLGSCFDTASVAEIEMVLAAGATPDRISYGNTIKKERDIARAYALGVRLFAVDCKAEVDKIARAAPARACSAASCPTASGPNGRCRASSAASRRWPSTCWSTPSSSGSSRTACRSMSAPSSATRTPGTGRSPRRRRCSASAASAASTSPMVNLGGGFPTKYLKNVPTVKTYGSAIFRALRKHFGNRIPETIIEPGRGMVGNAGVIEAEVVLVSKKSEEDDVRWVYLDIGKFGGLAETMDESIRYPIRTPRDGDADGALRARRTDLRLGRRAVREGALPAAGQPGDRRQGADRGHRRLHGDLLVGRLQRLPAAEDLSHLTIAGSGTTRSPHLPRVRSARCGAQEDEDCP